MASDGFRRLPVASDGFRRRLRLQVRFVTSGAAIELLTCQSAANKMVDKAAAKEQAIANGDEPPPLELPSLS